MKNLQRLLALGIAFLLYLPIQAQDTKAKPSISFETFEAKLKQASPQPQILDARSLEEYQLNHLKGAVNVSVTNEAELQKQLSTLDKQQPIFVYSINNGRSGTLAKKLREQHFQEVYELPGGISKWVGAGRPVESTVGNGLTLGEYQQLLKSDKLVLVDIHSKYCGGCKKLTPIVDSVASEKSNLLKVVKIELFDNKQLGKELNIESIPTLILYKGDQIVWQKSGITPKAALEEIIQTQLSYK
jgi:thioredoxin